MDNVTLFSRMIHYGDLNHYDKFISGKDIKRISLACLTESDLLYTLNNLNKYDIIDFVRRYVKGKYPLEDNLLYTIKKW